MTQDWINEQNIILDKEYEDYSTKIIKLMLQLPDDERFAECGRRILEQESRTDLSNPSKSFVYQDIYFHSNMCCAFEENPDIKELYRQLSDMCEEYREYLMGNFDYSHYLDSPKIHLKGTLLITDPCYLEHSIGINDDDACDIFYDNLFDTEGDKYGIMSSTIYGDWSCTTFAVNPDGTIGKELGEFCADAGMVCVTTIENVLKFNPSFKLNELSPWSVTKIDNFDGDVQIVITREEFEYQDDTEWWHKGDKGVEFVCHVEGEGINSVTGEKIKFITRQTGF